MRVIEQVPLLKVAERRPRSVRYLTDTDVLAWLDRCAKAIKPGGIIVVKENLATGNERFTLGACSLTSCDDANRKDNLVYATITK